MAVGDINTSNLQPGQVVGGEDRRLPNGGGVVDGRYIPPGINFGGNSSGGGGSSSSGSCPPGYKKNAQGKCVPKSSSGSEYTPGENVGGADRKLDNGGAVVDGIYIPPGLNLGGLGGGQPPVEEVPVEEMPQDEYLKFLQEQQAALEEQKRQEARESVRDIIGNLLNQYGLGSLTNFVNDLIFKEDIVSEALLLAKIRETDQYKERFKGMAVRRSRGLNMPSETDYIKLENTYRQVMRSAGIPPDLFDQPDDLSTLIGYDVSPVELNSRINDGYQAVSRANPEVVNQMRRLYGVSEGQLAAYFLDPERTLPVITRQAQSAQIASEAQLQAGQQITAQQAEELAVAGVTQEQAQQGFQTIAQSQELFNPLAGTTEATIGVEEQIAGIFGQSAAAQQRIRQRQRERQATFEAGGRFAGQGGTVTGLQ